VSERFATPVPRSQPPRDELAIKLAIAVTIPGVVDGTFTYVERGYERPDEAVVVLLVLGTWCSVRWGAC
jgi:hypothetical protein